MASIFSAVLMVAVVCATGSAQQWNPAEWEALKAVSHSNLEFSQSLFKVMSREAGNLFFSPASIHTILAMTSMGARGSTAQEMVRGLHLPADQQKTKQGFLYLMRSLKANSKVTTKIANRIYADGSFAPTSEFKQIAMNNFGGGVELVDFQHKGEESRASINSWVEKNTENKINGILPPGSVDSNTAMVLVNALYVKGAWMKKFAREATKMEPFHITADVTKDIPMMHLSGGAGSLAYINSRKLNADILEIPYESNNVSMIVVLPKERHGLSGVETRLAGSDLKELRFSAERTYPNVHLTLPKFKLEESTDLGDILKKMGMGTMFSGKADFSGLASGPIRVSTVMHKARIEVDENGSEVAAATGVEGIPLSHTGRTSTPQELTFKADHPFIFYLVNNDRGSHGKIVRNILFVGRFCQPN